jgi:uracil-DNA glycosylase family 4
VIPGKGPLPALGVVIGEQPMDLTALRLLHQALHIVGLPLEELYITLVVKEQCLDEENRVRRPFPAEIDRWSVVLQEELVAASPAAILTLGRTASDVFGNELQEDVYRIWSPHYVVKGPLPARFTTWVESIKPFAEHIDRMRA